jgi:hypothetical protein
MLQLSDNKLNFNPCWSIPLDRKEVPIVKELELFDTNGYDLTLLEQRYAELNHPISKHRYRAALKYPWFTSEPILEGAHINHALLFERKGYTGPALEQLQRWSKENPLVYKLIQINPKWGIDLSIDYVDKEGNVFEVFHYEWDDFNYEEVLKNKEKIETLALSTDWNDAAKSLLSRKSEWDSLSFFEQSDWKCNFFGIEPEKFKIIIWNKESRLK